MVPFPKVSASTSRKKWPPARERKRLGSDSNMEPGRLSRRMPNWLRKFRDGGKLDVSIRRHCNGHRGKAGDNRSYSSRRGSGEVGMGVEMDKVGWDRIHQLEVGGRGMNLEQMGQMKGREMNKSCGIGGEKPTEGLRTGSRMQVTENILENKTTG